ncbi:hypothetical protein NQ317_015874 [Molorchus minor]|uniref:Uncharacterized protein n=1 Tax=Molorchus minor TaxID=1323400 RepID=A0ABQ9J165_9CUCU|nr:hypothetical protein NQ317_015874 [Molorchus minor]
MFNTPGNSKGDFLEQTKAAREERALEKRRDAAAALIQANVRGWLGRLKFSQTILNDIDEIIPDVLDDTDKLHYKPATEIYHQALKFLFVWKKERDKERFAKLCRYLVASLDSDCPNIVMLVYL